MMFKQLDLCPKNLPACFARSVVLAVALAVSILFFISFFSADAFASAGAGGGLPYEDWLDRLKDSVTGPVAFTISLIGIVVAGALLIFGGDMNGFFKTLVLIVLVMALLVGAQNFMSSFFGKGAVVASIETQRIKDKAFTPEEKQQEPHTTIINA
jgi:type IV secretion system protein VirB2